MPAARRRRTVAFASKKSNNSKMNPIFCIELNAEDSNRKANPDSFTAPNADWLLHAALIKLDQGGGRRIPCGIDVALERKHGGGRRRRRRPRRRGGTRRSRCEREEQEQGGYSGHVQGRGELRGRPNGCVFLSFLWDNERGERALTGHRGSAGLWKLQSNFFSRFFYFGLWIWCSITVCWNFVRLGLGGCLLVWNLYNSLTLVMDHSLVGYYKNSIPYK